MSKVRVLQPQSAGKCCWNAAISPCAQRHSSPGLRSRGETYAAHTAAGFCLAAYA